MDYKSLVLLIVIHGLFDFALQTRTVATNKSSSLKYLLPHLFILMTGLYIYTILSGRYTNSQAFYFVYGNIILHGLIDWNIWRLYKFIVIKRNPKVDSSFKYYEDGLFYDFIMIDQSLHGFCYLLLDWFVRLA